MQKAKTRYEQIPLRFIKNLLDEELQQGTALPLIRSTKNKKTKPSKAIFTARADAREGSRP